MPKKGNQRLFKKYDKTLSEMKVTHFEIKCHFYIYCMFFLVNFFFIHLFHYVLFEIHRKIYIYTIYISSRLTSCLVYNNFKMDFMWN